jgi:hypothetical protein
VVIFLLGQGFVATGRIVTAPVPRPDWGNRYGASVGSVRLIEPAISLASIQDAVRDLAWARYPRSYHTPATAVANRVRALIARRRKTRLPELRPRTFVRAAADELRAVAVLQSRTNVPGVARSVVTRARSMAWRSTAAYTVEC